MQGVWLGKVEKLVCSIRSLGPGLEGDTFSSEYVKFELMVENLKWNAEEAFDTIR